MRRKLLTYSVTLLLSSLLISCINNNPRSNLHESQVVPSAEQEVAMKHALVAQDIKVTEELCRSSCQLDLQALLTESKPTLTDWQQKHPHIQYMIWEQLSNPQNKPQTIGQLKGDAVTASKPFIDEAKKQLSASTSKSYMSKEFKVGDSSYFVLGERSQETQLQVIAVVNQRILTKVADHQHKNMRLEPFPNTNRVHMKTVESGTHLPKRVVTPEDNEGTSHYETHEVVVKFHRRPTKSELNQILKETDGKITQHVNGTYVFKSRRIVAKDLVKYFHKWNVAYAEPHFFYVTNTLHYNRPQIRQTDESVYFGPPYPYRPVQGQGSSMPAANTPALIEPNDVLYDRYQWNLKQIGSEAGWQAERGGNNTTIVAVIDTGVDLTHPDLQAHLINGYNLVDPTTTPNDDVGHGTHVSGVVGAVVNNRLGVAGMVWNNSLMPIKALDQTGAGSTYTVAQGIIWAVDHGAKVINMSLGNYAPSEFLHDAIKYAYERDVVLVAASGNDNTGRPSYPAYYPEVFAVAATDINRNRAPFSNYGDYVDVAAPGVSIASTYPPHQYAALSGTSMASPHVAALAAMIRSINPALHNIEVMDMIRSTAQDLGVAGRDPLYGHGIIDVAKAVRAAQMSVK
ncbi:S8 family peptidase [Paenibacillus sp. N1-5-1-14]|uniref:S8 family peptidase n=1 Tax=Paenibacillus radicibacter TaxID=2972488 RepID=UPI002158E5DF|nr:S8 family peptidase [Paenibacillus radicibacter]MCR8641959.1 S8 family peptidase [Paenibacillus radicibacter]